MVWWGKRWWEKKKKKNLSVGINVDNVWKNVDKWWAKTGRKTWQTRGRLGESSPEALVATLAVDSYTGQVRHLA